MTAGNVIRTSIFFAPEERDALRQRAFRENRSVSDLVREAVRKSLGLDDPDE